MSDSHPENDRPTMSLDKRVEFMRRFDVLFRWMVLEGVVDPRDGLDFEVWQFNADDMTRDPEAGNMNVQGPKKFVAEFGMPDDPITSGMDNLRLEIEPKEE